MENTAQEELKAHLMATDENFREMCERHAVYDRKVAVLEAKHAPTPDDELEEVRLKKLKLHLKDQIAEFLHKAQTAQPV
jgi:uncharacterized protein YdcH (DUF465 family)